ncbi:MAG TPA: MarR family transcriptional regulator [Usitatibacter sp.]|nr:MarR family transcriptional regulator [Usitatibacter sp.]
MASRRTKRPAGELGPADYETLAAWRFALRRFLAFSDDAAETVGLTQQQYLAMLIIKASREPVTIGLLAEQLLVKHHSAVGLVDRLVQLGLVRRDASKLDRRKVAIRFTARGARVFARLAAMQRGELRRIGPDLARFMDFFSRASDGKP